MKKVFISQPMKGKTDIEILEQREYIAELARKKWGDVEIAASFFQDAPHDAAPLWFLGESLKVMSHADVLIACKGFHEARGCRVEILAAEEYGLPVYFDYGGTLFNWDEENKGMSEDD